MDLLNQTFSIILLALGFGFVIFFHELGHFLAAKWVGIRVEQFAVGFGHALLSFRKGMGWSLGSTGKKFETLEQEGEAAGVGETEYRLNWIPLGGYVKMLGQDDLKPNAQADDPRAYNKKSIGARMLVVSAGVIMNIILAAIGFMVVFLMGFRAPPAVVGAVVPGSPAQEAGLKAGERILYFDGKYQHDFTKITLNTALVEEGATVPMYVRGVDGAERHLTITPRRSDPDPKGFILIGVLPPYELRGMKKQDFEEHFPVAVEYAGDVRVIQPGDTITEIEGQAVQVDEVYKLDEALQRSQGNTVTVTVVNEQGQSRSEKIQPHFAQPFGRAPLNIAGIVPRASIDSMQEKSSAIGKLKPGDVILSISYGSGDQWSNPSVEEFIRLVTQASEKGQTINLTVIRDRKSVEITGLQPTVSLGEGRYGLGVVPVPDEKHAVVAETLENSPARDAKVPPGARIVSVDGRAVKNLFDLQTHLAAAKPEQPVKVTAESGSGIKDYTLTLSEKDLKALAANRYIHSLALHDRVEPRKTNNPLEAAAWGVTETRDFVLQFYLTLHRMVQGSVSYKNMMGPVGIFDAGRRFAYKGNDWLIWFLAMISANLAVVNFLPIPIVDGGLFTFLVIEKIQGKPVSPRTQAIAQVVGLALILSVFLLVTYQDIARMIL